MGKQLMKDVYHIAQTPDGVHIHGPLDGAIDALALQIQAAQKDMGPGEAQALATGEIVGRIRAELGFPEGFAGTPNDVWASHIAPGEPHPSLLDRAVLHGIEDIPGA